MKHILLAFVFSAISFVAVSQCSQNLTFNNWQAGGYPSNGNWSVQGGGSQIYQSVNGDPAFFVSPYNLMNVHISGSFRTTDNDDDWMGFVFSYLNPLTASDTFDCWLYDWKQQQQNGASSGMALCRLNGVIPPANYTPQFWNHQNSPEFTVVQNTFGGPGWNQGNNHNFDLYLTYTRAIIYVDNQPVFDWQDCYKPGRFGFYNYSQSDCIYSNFTYELYIDYRWDEQVCLGNAASFTFIDPCVTTMGQYQSLTWHFGDGTPDVVINNPTLANVNVTHNYTTPGVYTSSLTVVDLNGCSATTTHPVDVRTPITIGSTITEPLCNGASNGNIQALPAGGFGNYTYLWNNNTSTQTLPGLTAGTYTLTVTDGVCNSTAQFTLNQPTALTATTSHTDAPCNGNGSATITISGGTPPYSGVNWAGVPANGSGTSSLPAGTWIADFRDANSCSALLQYTETITALPCGITSSTATTNVTCFGVNNGTATLNVTTTTPPQNISWSNGGTGPTIANLAPGTYTYTYSDALPSHNFTGSVTITGPTTPMVVSLVTTPIACAGSNTGQATASVTSGGAPPYTYTWSGGHPNSPVAANLAAGPISVTVTDGNNCTSSASGSISSQASLNVTFTTTIDSCYRAGKGKALAHITGGNPPYTLNWSNFETDTANLFLIEGTYTLTVTDYNGCTTTGSATITGPATPLVRSFTAQDILCNGAATGSISASASGGTPGYTFTWSPANLTGPSQTNLAAGIYSFTVTDNYGCTAIGTDTLTQPATALAVTTSHTDVTCYGAGNGSLTINVSGGIPPYSFLNNPVPAGTTVIPNQGPGTYAGNVIDSNNCAVAVSETITEPGVQTLNVSSTNATCNGATDGTATANFTNATGNVVYSWTGGLSGAVLTGIGAGTYDVTATDGNNCTLTGTTTVTEPAAPVMQITATDAACFGGNGTATANPGAGTTPFTYTWSNAAGNQQTINPPAGSYTVTATDASSCNQTGSFTINQPTAIAVQVAAVNVACYGDATGSITLAVTGGTGPGYTYNWNPNVSTTNLASNIAAGNYNITITDQANCTKDTLVTITQPAAPLSTSTVFTDVTCFGFNDGTITTTPAGGTGNYNYAWSPNNGNSGAVTALGPGTYTVTITDANNCTLTDQATITEPAAALTLVATQIDLLCNGVSTGEASVTASGGTTPYTYTWAPNVGSGSTVNNLAAGQYAVIVTDDHNCTATEQYTITEPAALTVTAAVADAQCNGNVDGQITLTAGGGTVAADYGYQWAAPVTSTTNIATNLTAATYSFTITDDNNCTLASTATVNQPAVLQTAVTIDDVICFGENSGIVTAQPAGGTPQYSLSITADGVNFQNDVNNQFSNLIADDYTVLVNDANGCIDTTQVTVNEPALITNTFAPTDITCFGYNDGRITFTATTGGVPGFTYSLSNGDQNNTGAFTGLTPGNYTITVSDANNCTVQETTTITEPDALSIDVTPDPVTVKIGETIQLQTTVNQTGTVSYNWQPPMGLDCYDCAAPVFSGNYSATYTVTLTNSLGCTGTSQVTVTVIPNYDVFVPNVFTPNGDGTNDTWGIFGNLPGIKQIEIAVFNRIGEKVYQSNDVNFQWDGTYKGAPAPPGVYVYTAKFVWLNNHSDNDYKGTITLMR